jgi:hypothetical protein
MKKFIVGLLMLTYGAIAAAQPSATLGWTAVTTYSDGTTIPGTVAVTYNIYQSCVSASALSKITSGVTTLTTTITAGLADNETCYWAITAQANGLEGAQSNVGSKTFAAVAPGTATLTVK